MKADAELLDRLDTLAEKLGEECPQTKRSSRHVCQCARVETADEVSDELKTLVTKLRLGMVVA